MSFCEAGRSYSLESLNPELCGVEVLESLGASERVLPFAQAEGFIRQPKTEFSGFPYYQAFGKGYVPALAS